MRALLSSLCRANQGILQQTVDLMGVLIAKHGKEGAALLYKRPCPRASSATFGQHIRHSMDHMERVVTAAITLEIREIHYDTRERGTVDEHDWEAAHSRIQRVYHDLEQLHSSATHIPVLDHPVQACFMLSGADDAEYYLPSTVARELGFAAHHAIHHMALIKIMALDETHGQLKVEDLPVEFGRAPSTLNHERVAVPQ